MPTDACRELRPALGAAALGGLDPAEAIALRAHLDGCNECREELRELTMVARALPLADPDRVRSSALEPPAVLAQRVRDRVAVERARDRSRTRRRWFAGAGAVAAVAAAIMAVVLVVSSSSPSSTHVVFPKTDGVTASATLRDHAAGTEISFHVRGLDDPEYYWLWLTGDNGHRIAAGSFRGQPRELNLTMTTAIPVDKARRIWVTDSENKVVLDARLEDSGNSARS